MSTAAFSVTKWRKYRSARLYGTTMEGIIDTDLKDKNPPSSDTIVELMLLGDRQYMKATFGYNPTPVIRKNQRGMSIAAISHNPTHPFYKRVKNAFGYANSRRKKAGLPLDKWPIPIAIRQPHPVPNFGRFGRAERVDRRLIWSLNCREVRAARGMFRRYVRDGLVPFLVGSNGEASNRITVFDPASCEVLFKPPESTK